MLITRYCDKDLQERLLTVGEDDCLIRPILGCRQVRLQTGRSRFFSLRNFPLHVNQMEEWHIDPYPYVRIMADALAKLHWQAHVDAGDMEYVLAPGRLGGDQGNILPAVGPLSEHAMWILDFDLCKRVSMDEAGVDQCVKAFYLNEPYYPRPGRDSPEDQTLRNAFRQRFLETSQSILSTAGEHSHLPRLLMQKIEERGNRSQQIVASIG